MRESLKVLALILIVATGISGGTALASLESETDNPALPRPAVQTTQYSGNDTVRYSECKPRYRPAFIRTRDGTIIGVGYLKDGNNC